MCQNVTITLGKTERKIKSAQTVKLSTRTSQNNDFESCHPAKINLSVHTIYSKTFERCYPENWKFLWILLKFKSIKKRFKPKAVFRAQKWDIEFRPCLWLNHRLLSSLCASKNAKTSYSTLKSPRWTKAKLRSGNYLFWHTKLTQSWIYAQT